MITGGWPRTVKHRRRRYSCMSPCILRLLSREAWMVPLRRRPSYRFGDHTLRIRVPKSISHYVTRRELSFAPLADSAVTGALSSNCSKSMTKRLIYYGSLRSQGQQEPPASPQRQQEWRRIAPGPHPENCGAQRLNPPAATEGLNLGCVDSRKPNTVSIARAGRSWQLFGLPKQRAATPRHHPSRPHHRTRRRRLPLDRYRVEEESLERLLSAIRRRQDA